jgi:hypothetical protein
MELCLVFAAGLVIAADECMWRQTKECRADGPREPGGDKSCVDEIDGGASGYCECRGGHRVGFGCGHEEIVCATECSKQTGNDCMQEVGWVPVPEEDCPGDMVEAYQFQPPLSKLHNRFGVYKFSHAAGAVMRAKESAPGDEVRLVKGAEGCSFPVAVGSTGFCMCGAGRRVWVGCQVDVAFWDRVSQSESLSTFTCADLCSAKGK